MALANQVTERPCFFSSVLIIWPICIFSLLLYIKNRELLFTTEVLDKPTTTNKKAHDSIVSASLSCVVERNCPDSGYDKTSENALY